MPRAPATCKLSRTSVSPSRRRSWSCRHAASSSWASPWTPLFGRCASRGQTCTASRLPARVANAAVMHHAGAAVADRSASLRVHGGPSGPHFPPAAYRFIYDGPGLGAPRQPPRGGRRGHRVVGGIPAQLDRAGFLPAAARRRGGTRVCYRRERGRAWRGVRSDMAYAAWSPAFRAYHVTVLELLPWRSPSIAGGGMSGHTDSPAHGHHAGGAGFDAGHVYVPPPVACAPVFLFSLPSGTCICFWRTCRAAGILTLICFLGRRGSGPVHAGHCPCRRWFRLTVGSGFNTSPAGELRGCQHVTGLRVRAESVSDFLSGGGDPSPGPLQEFVLDLFVALRGTRLSVATLRTYVAGLQHFSFRFGFPTKVAGRHSLGLCCAASNAPRPTASRGRLGDLSVPP